MVYRSLIGGTWAGSSSQRGVRVAKKVFEELVDDLDGTPAQQTVRIGWDNEWRELDLSEKNLTALSKAIDRFWEAARPVTTPRPSARRGRRKADTARRNASTSDYDRSKFKSWAAENDIKLNRGRPPRSLVERFLASQR